MNSAALSLGSRREFLQWTAAAGVAAMSPIIGLAAVGHFDAGPFATVAALVAPMLVLMYGPKS